MKSRAFVERQMAQNLQSTEMLLRSCNKPILSVCTDNKSKFEEEIHIDCSVENVCRFENEVLTSNTLFVQSLPFVIKIKREKKEASKRQTKNDELHIQLHINKEIGPFSSIFSYQICALKNACHPIEFEVSGKNTLTHARNTISHAIEWEQVASMKRLQFSIHLSVSFPKGNYCWPSRTATGYSGLKNEGSTCYINSMLQSLFCTNEFRSIVYGISIGSNEEDVNDSFVFWLKFIFYSMQFDEGVTEIRTNKMIQCFDWDDMYEQQDIQEFLRRLIDKLYEFVIGTEFKDRLEDLFVGKLEIVTECEAVNFSNVKEEHFWDLQLSLNMDNILDAFNQYLEPLNITDFDYGDGKATAIRSYKFTRMPPVLHITLNRFNFNTKTNTVQKNNNRFEFNVKLDLSQHCAEAKYTTYTLHSVLVHSGKTTSGHYTAYISPKADNEWFLFNDKVVTRCTPEDAINYNYGNGTSNTNAYMLVYIKDDHIPQILREVSVNDVVEKNLIDIKIAKQKQKERSARAKDRDIEVIVYTPERLQMDNELKRGGDITEINSSITFWMEKNKTVNDIREAVGTAFSLDNLQDKLPPLWLLNEGGLARYCDTDDILKSKLNKFAKEKRINCFIELDEPMDVLSSKVKNPFDKTEHALIFIKEYDYPSRSLTFFGHQYFDLNQPVHNIRAHIRASIMFGGNEEDIVLIHENYKDGEYTHFLLNPTQNISKFANQFDGTFSAIVTFELLANHSKSKYLSAFFDARTSSTEFIKYHMTTSTTALAPAIVNGINVIVKQSTNRGKKLFSHEFDDQTELIQIVQQICELTNISIDEILLLDTENNVIDGNYFGQTIQDFMKTHTRGPITRNRVQKGLILIFKSKEMYHQPKGIQPPSADETSMNASSTIDEPEPMSIEYECEYDSYQQVEQQYDVNPQVFSPIRPSSNFNITVTFQNVDISNDSFQLPFKRTELLSSIASKFQQIAKKDLNNIEFSTHNSELLDMLQDISLDTILDADTDYIAINFRIEHTQISESTANQSTMSTSSNASNEDYWKADKKICLNFEDQTKEKSSFELNFSGEENLEFAIDQIIDVMDLDKSIAQFFDANGNQITKNMLQSSVSTFLEENLPKIKYTMDNLSSINLQRVSQYGRIMDWHCFNINESTTVQDICNSEQSTEGVKYRVLKMKDGIIHRIVAPETRIITLIGDGFTYRLDQYKHDFTVRNEEDRFFVCVRFVEEIPDNCTSILIEFEKYQTLRLLGIRVLKYLGKMQIDSEVVENFKYSVSDDVIIPSTDGAMSDARIVQPEDPSVIPLVELDMNERTKHVRERYLLNHNNKVNFLR